MLENKDWRKRRSVALCAVVMLCCVMALPASAAKFAGAFMENGGGARAHRSGLQHRPGGPARDPGARLRGR